MPIEPAQPSMAGENHILAEYDFDLPPELIAQKPAPERTRARMLHLPLAGGSPRHGRVSDLLEWLKPGDLLVMNNTKVVPARLSAVKPTGGKVEVFLLQPAHPLEVLPDGAEVHEVLFGSSRPVKPGMLLDLPMCPGKWVEVLERGAKGRGLAKLSASGLELASAVGSMPLPPYIKRPDGPDEEDERRYQTVYAQKEGAVAAPTAGLHFSRELLATLSKHGVDTAFITLHVGLGTFADPDPADIAAGKLHSEWVEVDAKVARAITRTREKGGRVIAVGTTSARSLEWMAKVNDGVGEIRGWCDILISPGHEFRAIDGLITNFHLPRTTLLMLVSALAGKDRVLAAYQEAINQRYRFFSFGDAMLII